MLTSFSVFQSHSLRCTESFNRENVVGELQQLQTNDETKQKMLEILKRFHSEEEVDSMDEDGMLLLSISKNFTSQCNGEYGHMSDVL